MMRSTLITGAVNLDDQANFENPFERPFMAVVSYQCAWRIIVARQKHRVDEK